LPEDHLEQVKRLFRGALISQFCQNETASLDHYSMALMVIANFDLIHEMWRSSEHKEHRRCIPQNLHWLSYRWDFPLKRIHFCAFWPESRKHNCVRIRQDMYSGKLTLTFMPMRFPFKTHTFLCFLALRSNETI